MSLLMFWVPVSLILYTYAVYPVVLRIVRMGKRVEQFSFTSDQLPAVSLVVSVHNEEKVLDAKMANLFTTEYPRGQIEFLFGSDGSDDGTNTILESRRDPALKAKIFSQRRGKAAILNELVPEASGEIIVFSDANTFYPPSTIQKLVRHFEDPSVGAVCGELILQSDMGTVGGSGESYYWNYENSLKRLESDIATTLGATGAVYAIRKRLFHPLPLDKLVMDDFLLPMSIIAKGYRVVYEPEARAFEQSTNSLYAEFRRKMRISEANFYGISEFAALLNPRYGFVSFALWSRKITRWCVPFLVISIALASLSLADESEFFRAVVYGGIIFLVLSLLGFVLERSKVKPGILGFPLYGIAMNAALFVGFLRFLFARRTTTWEVIR